jgi:hypothetical protein
MTTKYTKWRENWPNGQKYNNTFYCKTLQNLPNWDFWSENIPSGNPGVVLCYFCLALLDCVVILSKKAD